MPKIGPNKISIDPKAYAARVTRAKKTIANTDPATLAKINKMYPEIKKEKIVNKALSPKKATAKTTVLRTPAKGVKVPMPKVGNAPAKKKPMPLTGPAAVAEIQRQVSPGGMKKSEAAKKKATDKKYPGLYKRSK